jgi:hypothetical protein
MYANDPEMAERWSKETSKDKKLPERVKHKKPEDRMEKAAYDTGALNALKAFDLEKEALFGNMGGMIGKGMQWAGRALGTAPTGLGNAAGAVIGGVGGAIQGLSQGEGFKGMALRAGSGAISGALPLGAGMAAGMAMDHGINKMMAPKPFGM